MDHYRNYVKEREEFELYTDENGFFTYKVEGTNFLVKESFITPEKRNPHLYTSYVKLMVEMGKKFECERIVTTIIPSFNESTKALHLLIRHGFNLDSCVDDCITLVREI